MKTIICILFSSLLSITTIAQEGENIIRLKKEIKNTTQETSRVEALGELGNYYRFTSLDSSYLYSKRALDLSRKINNKKGEINALARLSTVLSSQGDFITAVNYGLEAIRIAEDNNLLSQSGQAMSALGYVYADQGNYEQAMKYYKMHQACYFRNNEPKIGEAYCYIDLSQAFLYMGERDSASYYIQKSKAIFEKFDVIEPGVAGQMGEIEFEKGNLQSSLGYFFESLKYSDFLNDINNKSFTLLSIAKVYQKLNKKDSSIFYAKKGLEAAKTINISRSQLEAARFLSQLYEETDKKEAFDYLKMATSINDSIFSRKNLLISSNIAEKEEERIREIETTKLSYQNKLKQYGFIGGLAIFLLTSIFLYRNNLRKQKANVLLAVQKEKVELTLNQLKSTQSQLIQSEKMASLGELTAGIAHEIQNPLNFVNNFSEVSEELVKEIKEERLKTKDERDEALEDEILTDIEQNLQKINHHGKRASSIVKGMLEHSRTSSGKKELTDINALADEYLRLSYNSMVAKDESFISEIVTNFDPDLPKIAVVSQDIGRVLLNLINNAFQACIEKASMPEAATEHGRSALEGRVGEASSPSASSSFKPTVTISTSLELTAKSQKQIAITIKDNGPGIPDAIKDKIFQPFFTTKDTGKGTGLGLSLAYDIVKAHGGEIELESKENEATSFTIKLPIA
jgi:two-component system, NtrC family, sensor kinase